MYCKHCGKELASDSKFCEGCGTSAITGKRSLSEASRKKGIRWLALCAAALAAAAIGFTALDYLKMCVDPREYVTVAASGFSGTGVVEIRFDEHDLLENKIKGFDPSQTRWDESYLENADPLRAFSNMLFGEKEKDDALAGLFTLSVNEEDIQNGDFSNGDRAVIDIAVNRELLEAYGYHTLKDHYQVSFVIGEDTELLRLPLELDYFPYLKLALYDEEGEGRLIALESEQDIPLETPIGEITTLDLEVVPEVDDELVAFLRVVLRDKFGMKVYGGTIGVAASRLTGLKKGDQVELSLVEWDWVDEKGFHTLQTRKTYTLE